MRVSDPRAAHPVRFGTTTIQRGLDRREGLFVFKIALLLIGGKALRRQWWALAVAGLALMGLALAVIVDLVDGATAIAIQAFGLVFVVEGLLSGIGIITSPSGAGRVVCAVKAVILLLLGGLILDTPLRNEAVLSWLFALAFGVDGLFRLGTLLLVRFQGWLLSVLVGVFELVLAALIVADWPLPHGSDIPLCISLLLLVASANLMRIAFLLRSSSDEVALLALPVFGARNWYDNAPVLFGEDDPGDIDAGVMTVRVWTPVGSAEVASRRYVVDRYFGTIDVNGAFSTGHSALECLPHVYISHWPAQELDPQGRLVRAFRAGAENDIPGQFQPSYAAETALWRVADKKVEFHHFNLRRLRAYWAGYRQEATYNLTNRNCSVAVAAGLDAALEGVLQTRFPWLRLFLLLLNPDVWAAGYIRSQAQTMCWTPGMVLDYALALRRIVDKGRTPWPVRAMDFFRRIRAARTVSTSLP